MGVDWRCWVAVTTASVCLYLVHSQVSLPFGCEFESSSLCDFVQSSSDDFDWSWNTARTPTAGTGPQQAHGGSFYVYTEASDPRQQGEKAVLETPILAQTGPICVEFFYHMFGRNIGSLSIGTSSRVWKTFNGSMGDQWILGQVDATLTVNDRVQFIGERAANVYGDIALDSVYVRPGQCIGMPLLCSFEVNFCGLTQRQDDQFDWVRLQNNTETAGTGPAQAESDSWYIYAEASYPQKPDDRAVLETPRLAYQGWICIQFWYHMFGRDMGSLEVVLSDRQTVLRRHGNQGDAWHPAIINANLTSGDKILFVAVLGPDFQSDIAIDTLSIKQGNCSNTPTHSQPGDSTTRLPPSTGTDDLVSCDFESAATENSICRVRQDTRDNFDWSFTQGRTPSGANYERRINDLRVPVTGPDGAHQGSYYSYIEASGRTTGLSAGLLLEGPMFGVRGRNCLRFFYSMNGFHCGELLVFLDTGFGRQSKWFMTGDKLADWFSAAVDLDMDNKREIGLIASTKGAFSGDISIDDIRLTPGPCEGIPSPYLWFCNFETTDGASTMCNMEEDQRLDTPGFDWTLWRSETPSDLTGPTQAHNGPFYIYIETSQPRRPGDVAKILIPHLNTTGSICLVFWCHMYGFHIFELQVFVRRDDQDVPIWRLEKEQGDFWAQYRVTVEDLNPDVKIGFAGIRGGEYSGDIALDNMQVRPGAC